MSRPIPAYSGMSVVGFRPQRAPRPSCCSDPSALCVDCARTAMAHDGLTTNCEEDDEFVLNRPRGDADEELLNPYAEDDADDSPVLNRGDDIPEWARPPEMLP